MMEKSQSLEMPSKPDLPEIIIDGKKVIDPAHAFDGALEEITQLAMLGQMVRIRKNLDDRQAAGYIETWEEQITNVRREFMLSEPAQSLGVFNDGPGAVFIWINSQWTGFKTIAALEPFNMNLETHALNYFWLQSAPGVVANIRAVARR